MPRAEYRDRKARPRVRDKQSALTSKARRVLDLIRERLAGLHSVREWTRDESVTAAQQLQAEGKLELGAIAIFYVLDRHDHPPH